jgi:hypothetical protein
VFSPGEVLSPGEVFSPRTSPAEAEEPPPDFLSYSVGDSAALIFWSFCVKTRGQQVSTNTNRFVLEVREIKTFR